jgi:hypothetical protein
VVSFGVGLNRACNVTRRSLGLLLQGMGWNCNCALSVPYSAVYFASFRNPNRLLSACVQVSCILK